MRFRHKPAVVEAAQLVNDVEFDTPTGRARGRAGDWLVTTDTGEKRVVPRETFETLYEPITSPEAVEPRR